MIFIVSLLAALPLPFYPIHIELLQKSQVTTKFNACLFSFSLLDSCHVARFFSSLGRWYLVTGTVSSSSVRLLPWCSLTRLRELSRCHHIWFLRPERTYLAETYQTIVDNHWRNIHLETCTCSFHRGLSINYRHRRVCTSLGQAVDRGQRKWHRPIGGKVREQGVLIAYDAIPSCS